VAAVVGAAARAAGLPAADITTITRAGLIHDVGRVGIPARLLSKSGPLSRADRERIHLHTYLTGRIFAENPVLAEIGALGCSHHEQLDGSGYHRGLTAPALPAAARLLAAANAWCAMTEARPHRPQMSEAEAGAALAAKVREGLLDRRAVDAVLTATGQKGSHRRRAASPALSERETEVLRLVARQETNAGIAAQLKIAPKTVERHVTHVFDKLGVSTRAGAALRALEDGLI
jgi:HD-GYP domain-containing protein (c-di-GMP phosphodiesterase class II)